MKLLLDTHAILWWFFNDPRLSTTAYDLIAESDNVLLASSASAWEIATKHRLGKLPEVKEIVRRYPVLLREARMTELTINSAHALRSGSYPQAHRDPFDRMLAAQAEIEDIPLLSADTAFADFPIECIW